MSKKTFLINNFSGGLNQTTDKRKIQDNEISFSLNARVNENNTIGVGGELGLYLYNLPHSNTNFQVGYGLFATSVDATPSILDAEFESGFEEGTVQAYTGTTLTLAATPSFQSTTNHATNDFYNNMTVVIVEGNGIGESRRITDYVGSSKQATITDAFSGSVDSSSKYKIFKIAGDNTKFGNANELDYIDKGGADFPYDDINSHDTDYDNSYFLRSKSGTISDGASLDLGFVTYNPKSSVSWAAGDALGTDNTTLGNNTLKSGITYNLSFYCKAKYQYYGYISDADNSANQRGERVPFVQIYSDSVTDGTNTGLYLFQSPSGTTFLPGSDSTYNYADNLTNEHVKNGDFEDGTANGGDGGHGVATDFDPPTDWMAYDGFTHDANKTITYSFETGSNAYGSEGNTLNMNPGSAFALDQNNVGGIPNCYFNQDLTLEDNQWYELSYMYSTSNPAPLLSSIVDTFNLTSTGIVSNEGTLAATDGDAVLTVDGTTATDALVKNREIYTSTGVFLGVCTTVNSGTEIRFAAGTAAAIDNDTTLYVANYIKKWEDSPMPSTGGSTTYFHGGAEGNANRRFPLRFFVPDNSGTPRVIRIAFAPFVQSQDIRLDGVSVKKSLPDLVSMSNKKHKNIPGELTGNPYTSEILSWNKYEMTFKIPYEYDNATDWVINFNAGSFGFQNGATNSYNHQVVYFDTLRIETSDLSGDLLFLNDNTSTESKINIYSKNENKWQENTGLTWSGINMKPVYNYINGMLKISDANFESGNTSKLYYYDNLKYRCRENPLSLPPSLEVSANGNGMEVDNQYQAVKYINEHSYLNGHQFYGATPTTTNWDLDKLDINNGRIIWYYSPGGYGNNSDLEIQENVLFDAGGTECTQVHYSESKTNPMYFTWCGQHGGSGNDIDNDDMHTQISSTTTGSISKIEFQFTYEFQGGYSAESNGRSNINEMNPPIFHITAGKRASTATDVFGSGSIVSDENKKQLSIGNTTYLAMENSNKAIIYTDASYSDLYDIEDEIEKGIPWQYSQQWLYSSVIDPGGNDGHMRQSEKTFYGTISFEDGDIEITDDVIFEVRIEYPNNSHGKNLQDALDRNYTASVSDWNFPRWEKIKFPSILCSFRSTSWTALTDGFTASNSKKTKTNFTFGTPSGATAFGWGERMFSVGVSSVNIFDEESNIEANSEIIGLTASDNVETSQSTISSGQCPDVSVYVGMDVFNDDYRKKLKYYMKDTTSDIWYLQFFIDLQKNIIYSTTSNYQSTGIRSDVNKCYQYFIPKENILNYNEVDSYESQTLVSQNLKTTELICDYKTAVVANSRLYVGNIRQNGELFPDRMLKSPIGKYNILPKDSFIDVAINDGDEIVALEYFESKLLQFKKRKLFIINTSGDFEFLEKTYNNIGVSHPMQVTKTPYGIVWANSKGCYLYDGNQLIDLIQNKLTNDELIVEGLYYWNVKDDIENNIDYAVSVGYNAKTEEIIVKRGHNEGVAAGLSFAFATDGFVYSFKTKTWYLTYKSFQFNSINNYPPQLSNFVTTADGDCIAYGKKNIESQSWGTINKWVHAEATDKSTGFLTQNGITNTSYQLFTFKTKEFDLGNPNIKKRLYKIIINYENSDNNSNSVKVTASFGCDEYIVDVPLVGNTAFITADDTFNNSRNVNYSSSTGFAESNSQEQKEQAILYPTIKQAKNFYTVFFTFESISLAHNTSFKIHSIELIYRDKSIR